MFSQERRDNHEECNDTRSRKYTRRVSSGEVWFCHNCGDKGFLSTDGQSTPRETINNVIHVIKTNDISIEQTVKQITLPWDVISEIPPLGLGWLYKYYITDEEIKKYNICYSEQYHRLILPVYSEEGLIYWQGRSLKLPYTKDNPKYLNIRQSGAKSVFFKSIHYTVEDSPLVIVEDVLSAIRVGRTHNSLALLGSYFPSTLLNEFREYQNIIIYLDYDKRETAIKAAIRFNKLTGKRFVVRQHPFDPKALVPLELEQFLTET